MLIHQGTLRYFSKKNPERPFRSCGFFLKNSLMHQHLISRDCLEKKEKKLGGLRIGGVRGGAVSSGGRCAVTEYLKDFFIAFFVLK